MTKKKLLIISYFFPPFNNMASRRWAQMIPFLEDELDIYVLTMNSEGDLRIPLDKDKIFRVGFLHNANFSRSTKGKASLPQRMIGYLRKDLRTVDSTLLSFYYKNRKGFDNIINKVNPEFIITSLGPFSSAFFGRRAKGKNKKIKWIVDLRDPMGTYTNNQRSKFRHRLDTYIDRLILSKSDLILTTSKLYADQLSRIYKRNVHILYNGFENISRIDEKNATSNQEKIIYYAGQIYEYREESFEILLKALSSIENGKLKLVIRLLGIEERYLSITKICDSYPNVSCQLLEAGSDKIVQEEMSKADYLLLLEDVDEENPMSGTIPGKLFEYLPMPGQIISVSREDSPIKDILNKTNRGECFRSKEKIVTFFNNSASKDFSDRSKIFYYSRENQAKRMSDILKNL